MQNVVIVSAKTSNSYFEIMEMPYIAFRCFLYHLRNLEKDSYASNVSAIKMANKIDNNALYQTEPDMTKIKKYIVNENKGGV